MSDIQKELSRIQKELKAPKGQTNNFGKYRYRSCEDILEALKLVLNDSSVMLDDEIVMVGDRVYVKATAYLCHNGHSMNVSAFARESETKKGMDESQITGSASSYARKYALNGLFAIDDTKDADTMKPEEPVLHTAAQKDQLDSIMNRESELDMINFSNTVGPEVMESLYNSFEKGQKTKKKALVNKLITDGFNMLGGIALDISRLIEYEDPAVTELTSELTPYEKRIVCKKLSKEEIKYLKELNND